jgi:hypothetical protein
VAANFVFFIPAPLVKFNIVVIKRVLSQYAFTAELDSNISERVASLLALGRVLEERGYWIALGAEMSAGAPVDADDVLYVARAATVCDAINIKRNNI